MNELRIDTSHLQAQIQGAVWEAVDFWTAPHVLMRPSIVRDGNKWSVLYGSNLMDGVAGFGDTPAEAMADFDRNWRTQGIAIDGSRITKPPSTDLDRRYDATDGAVSPAEAYAAELRELLEWATRGIDLTAPQSTTETYYFARIRAALGEGEPDAE